jgi:hypothetical protein
MAYHECNSNARGDNQSGLRRNDIPPWRRLLPWIAGLRDETLALSAHGNASELQTGSDAVLAPETGTNLDFKVNKCEPGPHPWGASAFCYEAGD